MHLVARVHWENNQTIWRRAVKSRPIRLWITCHHFNAEDLQPCNRHIASTVLMTRLSRKGESPATAPGFLLRTQQKALHGAHRQPAVRECFRLSLSQTPTEATTMTYEVIVEGFVLQVEVTHCENTPPSPGTWSSDWDAQGCRELEFKLLSAICYDEDGVRMDVEAWQMPVLAHQYAHQIETALWVEIDSQRRRERWVA